MYLHKVRKSPLEGFNVNLSNSQMIAVIVIFLLFFITPILTLNKSKVPDSNSQRVQGIQTSIYDNSGKTKLLKITRTAALVSGTVLVACIGVLLNDYYYRNRSYEL